MTVPSDLDALLRRSTVAASSGGARPGPTGPPSAELPPGATLRDGRFVVEWVLGRGGFGVTYATWDHRLQRRVAIKELFPGPIVRHGRAVLAPAHAAAAFAEAKARFLREARVLARFSHPGIVRVYEVFEEHGTAYLVMELLDGRTLTEVLAERSAPLSEAEALDLATRCAQALAVVHAAGVLHRDLNPSNVMVTSSGRVVLIDFGLAREFAGDATGSMTRLVTPGYAPLEQYLGEGRFGPPTDVYGLAATIYWSLAGLAPVSALDRQGGVPLLALHRVNPAVSRAVSAAVLDGLELNAGHRPRTMGEFLARLGIAGDRVPPRSALLSSPAAVPTEHSLATGATTPIGPAPWPAATAAAPTPQARPTAQAGPSPQAGPAQAPVPWPSSSPPQWPLPAPPRRMPGWWKAAAPALVVLAAMGSAAPVLVPPLLALTVLPALATAGDAVVFVRLRRDGPRLRWLHRVALPAFVPLRFVRNLAAGLVAGVPALLVAGVTVSVALLLDGAGVGSDGRELVLRPGGAAAAVLLAVPVLRDRRRFRAAVVGELVARRLVDGTGRLTSAGLVTWAVAAFLAVAGLGLRPDLWPLT